MLTRSTANKHSSCFLFVHILLFKFPNYVMLGGNRLEEIDEERQKSLKLNEAGVGLVRSLIMTQSDLSG